MRGWLTLPLALAACDPAIKQIGPGTGGFPTVGTNPATSDTSLSGANYVCDKVSTDGTCKVYYGVSWTESTATADCGIPVSQGSCPSTDQLGSCLVDEGGPNQMVEYYYSNGGSTDVQLLSDACAGIGGQWKGTSSYGT